MSKETACIAATSGIPPPVMVVDVKVLTYVDAGPIIPGIKLVGGTVDVMPLGAAMAITSGKGAMVGRLLFPTVGLLSGGMSKVGLEGPFRQTKLSSPLPGFSTDSSELSLSVVTSNPGSVCWADGDPCCTSFFRLSTISFNFEIKCSTMKL